MNMLDVADITAEFLKNSDYDGLYQPEICACKKDDLAPCGQILSDCDV